jgi:tetratricopeptide (TPR) repeat protein
MRSSLVLFVAVAVCAGPALGADPAPVENLPISGLAPARVVPNLCTFQYRVTTTSAECQTFCDQGSGYFQSYVWMEAARSYETAARKDPECILAWWGLSRALEKWGKGDGNQALTKAKDLLSKATPRDRMLVLARMQEKGLEPNIAEADRRKTAARTIDELLALYDDDEEAWFYRAQLADGTAASVPFYKALLRINPLHPGANHELVHFYEGLERPALGWTYAENYIRSSPGVPHAFHMQAHLATRLGRWDRTSDLSARAIQLEKAYHQTMNVKPTDDHQYNHHLEILTRSLIHDGRFDEARKVKQEAWDASFRHWGPWFRLFVAERDWPAALETAEQVRKKDKFTASYMSALVFLHQGNPERAAAEIEVLRQGAHARKPKADLLAQLWETQGLLLCQTGSPDAGLKLLAKAVDGAKSDYWHHAWGGGAYEMEVWGTAALQSGREEVAEEAFLEALAHDPGSVRAALGMGIICERQGRAQEAQRYAEMAQRTWRKAAPDALERERAWLIGKAATEDAGRATP